MSGPRMKRVALELGGNAPCVILDDADVEHAVRATVIGRYLHQGQICMNTNRIIVDAKVYDEFVDGFTAHVEGPEVWESQRSSSRHRSDHQSKTA